MMIFNDDIIILIIITPLKEDNRVDWPKTMDPGCVASILATASLNIAFTSLAEHRHFLSDDIVILIILIVITPLKEDNRVDWPKTMDPGSRLRCFNSGHSFAEHSFHIFHFFLSALLKLNARHSDQYEGHVCLYTANLISHKIIAMGFKNHMIMMTSPGAA